MNKLQLVDSLGAVELIELQPLFSGVQTRIKFVLSRDILRSSVLSRDRGVMGKRTLGVGTPPRGRSMGIFVEDNRGVGCNKVIMLFNISQPSVG